MTNKIDRREFIKLGALGFSLPLIKHLFGNWIGEARLPNILIVVFDAWSAKNISLYGYERDTTPNLERLAEKAIVYHNHYAGGANTTPGTATLLTGQYPWSHGAMKRTPATMDPHSITQNVFTLFKQFGYHSVTYTHNPLVEKLLRQLVKDISVFSPWSEHYLGFTSSALPSWFPKDFKNANIAWQILFHQLVGKNTPSLYFHKPYTYFNNRQKQINIEPYEDQYPRGLTKMDILENYFVLREAIEAIVNQSAEWPQPYLGYYHFYPPHKPYNASRESVDAFKGDGYKPIEKPLHPIFGSQYNRSKINFERRLYDEFILDVDAEFAWLYQNLEQNGVLENTWLILTSDHGEMFERGTIGHQSGHLNSPGIKIPLLIFPPGQENQVDVFSVTSATDLLPTLTHLANKNTPDWCEGVVLPPFQQENYTERPVYAMNAKGNHKNLPWRNTGIASILNQYKITKWFNYGKQQGDTLYAAYDLENDPEELENLFESNPGLANDLQIFCEDNLTSIESAYINNET
jgi:arylsulfatase A-like enzyme